VYMTNEELIRKYDDLISAAKSARENAVAPFSNFRWALLCLEKAARFTWGKHGTSGDELGTLC